LRMLVTLQLNPAKMELISGFIDTYLRLNTPEEQQLETELKQANLVEQEQIMEIVTSWMEKGIKQGIEQGEQKIVKKLLKRRFNNITPSLENRINELSVEQIESLADAIFDFQSVDNLINWLDQQK
ncbi:MAG: DUF4351 domain-containing protein, partial [Sphaerospermopsis kisseleviana]